MQIHVLSDLGLHCIVEEYILSSGLLFIIQFTHGDRTETSRLRAVWGIWSVMYHPVQALTAPSSHLVMLYIIIYIYRCTVNWSVPRSAEQISRCSFWCVSIAIRPQVLTSPVVSEDWVGGTALAKPLAFAEEAALLEFLLLFVCTLPCHKIAAMGEKSTSTGHSKSGHANQKVAISRTDVTKPFGHQVSVRNI